MRDTASETLALPYEEAAASSSSSSFLLFAFCFLLLRPLPLGDIVVNHSSKIPHEGRREGFACVGHSRAQSYGMRAGNEFASSMTFPAGRGLRLRAGTPAPRCGNLKFKLRIRG